MEGCYFLPGLGVKDSVLFLRDPRVINIAPANRANGDIKLVGSISGTDGGSDGMATSSNELDDIVTTATPHLSPRCNLPL